MAHCADLGALDVGRRRRDVSDAPDRMHEAATGGPILIPVLETGFLHLALIRVVYHYGTLRTLSGNSDACLFSRMSRIRATLRDSVDLNAVRSRRSPDREKRKSGSSRCVLRACNSSDRCSAATEGGGERTTSPGGSQ